MRQRTILNPKIQAKPGHHVPSVADYISVNAIDTYGVWTVWQLLGIQSRARLALWTNQAEIGIAALHRLQDTVRELEKV